MRSLVSDLVKSELKEYDVRYDTECPYWNQVLLNDIKLIPRFYKENDSFWLYIWTDVK